VYGALLELGPSTGYAVARTAGFARANTYAALEGLVRRGAARRAAGRPARYRAADPSSLMVLLAAEQGERLERLNRALADLGGKADPVTRTLEGARAVANVVQQLVARASRRVDGVIAAELWRPTLPAWRRAATRARLQIRVAGEAEETQGLATPGAPSGHPTMLLVDGTYTLVAALDGSGVLTGLWSGDPLVAILASSALGVPA
jgi:sugar-specific transcriptional regulator TrmB